MQDLSLGEGEPEGVRSPTEVGTGKAKDEKMPLSEIIQILNERWASLMGASLSISVVGFRENLELVGIATTRQTSL
jgi:hypothetical protein